MVKITSSHAGYAGHDVKNHKARASIQLLDLRSDDPQRIRIEKNVQQSDVNKNGCHKTPPLPARDFLVGLDAESQQRFVRTAGQSHQHEDQEIEGEEEVREGRTTAPHRMQEFEMIFLNHRRSYSPLFRNRRGL